MIGLAALAWLVVTGVVVNAMATGNALDANGSPTAAVWLVGILAGLAAAFVVFGLGGVLRRRA
jgi:hypothetical protein